MQFSVLVPAQNKDNGKQNSMFSPIIHFWKDEKKNISNFKCYELLMNT